MTAFSPLPLLPVVTTVLLSGTVMAKEKTAPDKVVIYKDIDGVRLRLDVFDPEGLDPGDQRPAIVFFFGGGWTSGTPRQFHQQARHFSELGLVAFSAEYRVMKKHETTPFECVKDAKSAIRWVRAHAAELGVDPDRIIAAGGSAGGHVAACTGVIEGHEEKGDDPVVPSRPDAMILFNPVVDTTDVGHGKREVGEERQTEISPCHHVREGIPPTLILHGTQDSVVPYENVERFHRLMEAAGNSCRLVPFEGRRHGFFNGAMFRPKNGDADFDRTMEMCEEFLAELGYVGPCPGGTRACPDPQRRTDR